MLIPCCSSLRQRLSDKIANALHAKGLVDTPVSTPFGSIQEAADALIWGLIKVVGPVFGSKFVTLATFWLSKRCLFSRDHASSRGRAVRGRATLGWEPSHRDEDFLQTIDEQVQFVIEEDKLLEGK